MRTQHLCIAIIATLAATQVASAQQYTRQGAILGGATGALAGAAIGKQNKETAAGALIGGAVGLITGSAIGNSMDEQESRSRAAAYARQQQFQRRVSRAVSAQDVVTMVQNGVSESVIVSHIHQNGVRQRLKVHDVIHLHKQGVSEGIINAMQSAPLATAPPPQPAPVYRRPVVIEEHHYVAPPRYYPPVRYRSYHYPPPRRPARSSMHWHFRF